jgi:sugar O-acyltransferase (sialic acid O-acetyltransferase NeuD family)
MDLVIIGAGGHASAVWDAASSAGFTTLAFVDPGRTETLCGVAVVQSLDTLEGNELNIVLGMGTNFSRESEYQRIKQAYPAARFPSIVHAAAWVSPMATVSDGTVVMSLASVGPGCALGVGAVVNTGSSLDHDSALGAFASLGPGAHTGGNVRVGERSVVGLNSGILQGRTIGSDSVIGAQSLVNKDLPNNVLAYGAPAVIVRERAANDLYY